MVAEEAIDIAATALTAYVCPLANVTLFKYLVRILSTSDEDFPELVHNLSNVRKKWVWLSRVMGKKGSDA